MVSYIRLVDQEEKEEEEEENHLFIMDRRILSVGNGKRVNDSFSWNLPSSS